MCKFSKPPLLLFLYPLQEALEACLDQKNAAEVMLGVLSQASEACQFPHSPFGSQPGEDPAGASGPSQQQAQPLDT